ncbi:DUF6907 domain-containing protein [uncultured Phycicoccus sp.]|uniref:DUF6907 domain-containing protein n=1 Tax=uncultured Phycicoccus sp. TaxID=661422 RepID=UPI00260AED02|nr:hypothetical protein [uncultured Phycicoccus sp.]
MMERPAAAGDPCPAWCRITHGTLQGEEDRLHLGVTVYVRETPVRLCMTAAHGSTPSDGPYVIVGEREFTLDEADALSAVVARLVEAGSAVSPRAGAAAHSRGR